MKKLENHVSLKNLHTFGINVYAQHFLKIRSQEELINALLDIKTPEPLLILGGGSNILFTQDFEGLVIGNEIKGIEILEENVETILLKVGAGENWHNFVMYCVLNEYYGVENLSLIPGTVGAAPIQNIGAYGAELKDVFVSLRAIRLRDGKLCEFTKADCQFGYRFSIFKSSHKNQFAIVDVTFRLSKIPSFNTRYAGLQDRIQKNHSGPLSLKIISDAVIQIRQEKLPDPKKIGNAGSFFKNPEIPSSQFEAIKKEFENIPYFPAENGVKIPAAWLIEQCGYKGKRLGDIGVHSQQALVLVNYGNGKGQAIADLAAEIADSVKHKFNIQLETEVNII
jgi:UDP-N-acetylmuramate dehydrogenase